ncbi:MAG TPA: hypothetical protein VJB11_03420 [archaeon]|nr:hypothetical protein [archaeon]
MASDKKIVSEWAKNVEVIEKFGAGGRKLIEYTCAFCKCYN